MHKKQRTDYMKTKTKPKQSAILLLLLPVIIGVGGCTDYYAGSPAYGPGYAGYGTYGAGYAGYSPYGPGYAGSPGYAAAPQAPSRSRLAIGRIILAVRAITWATLITYGGRTLGMARRTKSLDPRALRHKMITKRHRPERFLSVERRDCLLCCRARRS
jgi:hypothetical protein